MDDIKVRASVDHHDDYVTFSFSMPNADLRLRIDRGEPGAQDAAALIGNLEDLFTQAVTRLQEG